MVAEGERLVFNQTLNHCKIGGGEVVILCDKPTPARRQRSLVI